LIDKQYGFREKHSTYMALLDLIDHITEELDSKKFSRGQSHGRTIYIRSILMGVVWFCAMEGGEVWTIGRAVWGTHCKLYSQFVLWKTSIVKLIFKLNYSRGA